MSFMRVAASTPILFLPKIVPNWAAMHSFRGGISMLSQNHNNVLDKLYDTLLCNASPFSRSVNCLWRAARSCLITPKVAVSYHTIWYLVYLPVLSGLSATNSSLKKCLYILEPPPTSYINLRKQKKFCDPKIEIPLQWHLWVSWWKG